MYKFSIQPINGFKFDPMTGFVESTEELHEKIKAHLDKHFSDSSNLLFHTDQIYYHHVPVGSITYEGQLSFFQDLKRGLKKAIKYTKIPYRWGD